MPKPLSCIEKHLEIKKCVNENCNITTYEKDGLCVICKIDAKIENLLKILDE